MLQRPIIRHDSPRWQPIYTLQFLRCIPLSKREAKIQKSGWDFCVRQVYFKATFNIFEHHI